MCCLAPQRRFKRTSVSCGIFWRSSTLALAMFSGHRLAHGVDCRMQWTLSLGAIGRGALREAWEWLRHAIPSRRERDPIFGMLRQDMSLDDATSTTDRAWTALDPGMVREELEDRLLHDRDGLGFLQVNNPIVRHTILRRRRDLEQAGLLRPVAVDLLPERPVKAIDRPARFLADGSKGIATSPPLEEALAAAERFCEALGARKRGAGYIKSLLLQRICSSAASGLATSRVLLGEPASRSRRWWATSGGRCASSASGRRVRCGRTTTRSCYPIILAALGRDMAEEREELREAIALLEDIVAQPRNSPAADPKWRVLRHFLIERDWLRHGTIVFSQFFDTVFWAATSLAEELPTTPVAVYAGAGRSGVFREGSSSPARATISSEPFEKAPSVSSSLRMRLAKASTFRPSAR